MKKVFAILLLSSILFVKLQAQLNLSPNLVTNPSFEYYTQCPDQPSQITFAYPWTDCLLGNGSTDYYNFCGTSSYMIQFMNVQHPRNGYGMAGIYLYGTWINDNYREYLSNILTDSLKKGKRYCGEFYTSLLNYCKGGVENIGIYFSINPIIITNNLFTLSAQLENHKGIMKDTLNWMKVCGSFLASGGEKNIIIGNFKDNIHTNYLDLFYGVLGPYYFIDDVSVCECSFEFSLGRDTTLCNGQTLVLNPNMPNAIYTWQDSSHAATYKVTKTGTYWVRAYFPDYGITTSSSINVTFEGECMKIPNIFTPNNDGKNDNFVIENSEGWNIDLQIFNRWGAIVYQNNTYKNTWDGKDVADGVYYYIIKATNNNSGIKKEYKGSVTVLR